MTNLSVHLLVAAAFVGGGYWWGHTATDNGWQARQAKASQDATQALQKETARADQTAGRYLTEHLDQEDRYDALSAAYQDLRGRAPLVVSGRLPDGTPRFQEARTAGADANACAPAVGSVDVAPRLTLAAVRMWNGALTGTDQAAGACGPAGAAQGADAACAQDSGLDLGDVWDNHTANAKACAADRQRYQHLIDFLNGK